MTWFFVVPGAALAAWAGVAAGRGWRSSRWPAVPGEIVATLSRQELGAKGRPVTRYEVRYRYEVGGIALEGTRLSFGVRETAGADPGAAGLRLAGLGTRVTVFQHPRDPRDAVLRRGVLPSDLVLLALGLALVAAGAFGLV